MSQKYQFPIKKPGTNGGAATDYTYDEIMDALDDSGHYLLGKNNRWHGGVHYAQSFSDDVTQREPVYTIGKGTIVAYRLKKEESILQAFDPSDSSTPIQETKYDYSSSFVLIKHELRVDIEPANTEENASAVLGNQLNELWSNQEVTLQGNGQQVYNSADLNTHNRDPLNEDTTITLTGVDPVLVDFGDHQSYMIRGRKSDGTDVWLEGFDDYGNVLESDGTALLTLNNPDAVNTPPAEDTDDEGTKLLTFYSLYMHLAHYDEYTATQKKVKTAVANMRTRQYDSATKVVNETEAGVIRRNIPKGEIITIIDTVDINEDGSYIVGKISDTEIIVIKKSNKFYATIEQKGLSRPAYWPEGNTPPTLNAVTACEIPVEKGALIGHLGIFETPTSATGGKNQKHQVHIEIFTEDNAEFEKFYRNDRNLFQDQKYIRLRDGYTISSKMSETASDTNTLHTVIGEHILKLDISDAMTSSDNIEYYRLLNIPNDVFANNPITTGYIRKDSLRGTGVFCQHDWDQLGFTLVKENNDNADGFIDVPETPEFFQEIYQTITETTLPDENDQPVRGTDEFKLAALKFRLNDKLFRDRWSKIIAKHPTEWEVDGENDRWQLLKDIFEIVKNKSNIEKHERERITNLVFWDDLGEKPSQTNLLHFHPMAFVENLILRTKKECPIDPKYRSHFVIHSTGGVMQRETIEAITNRSKAHKYIMEDGEVIIVWPFTEKNVWATKIESRQNLKGRMFHVELNYKIGGSPSIKQYESLADLYQKASDIEGCWPIIVPHIEVDRGIANGHRDPENFDYNYFYQLLRSRGIPIDNISHFDHDRYWEKDSYKIPWGTDKTSWPPVLIGNPHK